MKLEGRSLWRAKSEYVNKYNLNAPTAGLQADGPLTAPAATSSLPGVDNFASALSGA